MHNSRSVLTRVWVVVPLVFLLIASTGWASRTFEPVFKPELSIDKTSSQIKIDGDLTGAEWVGAAQIQSFVERYPGDNVAPDVETRTYVTYDADHLYVAFVCLDDPAQIRATMCQRDQFFGDDAVTVLIDTYGDASWAYEFYVNPYGVQKDYLWSSVGGEDRSFDLTWRSAAKITDSGYQVEMAVPFSAMRFPSADVQQWKMDFWRSRPRETSRTYSWAAYDRNEQCWPCQWGTISGIGSVRPGKGVELLPSYVAFQTGELSNGRDPQSEFVNGDLMGELAVSGKYSLSSDATVEATFNPDFSQIEADAAQVDVNTTIALLFPERRPFFQEGADVFRTLFNSFYTRTVYDPEYAVKLVSRKQNVTVGFMSAQDETTPYIIPLEERSILLDASRSWVNALRVTKPIGSASHVGAIVTDRRFEGGGYGTILAADGRIRLSQVYNIDGQVLASFSKEPGRVGESAGLDEVKFDRGTRTAMFDGETFTGNAFIARFNRFARHWNFMFDYNQVDPSYRTQTGYDPWVDYRNGSFWTQYTFYPESGPFQRIQPQFYTDARWLYDGTRRWEHQNLSVFASMRTAQTWIQASVRRGSEDWTSRVDTVLLSYDDLRSVNLGTGSRFSNQLGYSFNFHLGRNVARFADATGNEYGMSFSLNLKPIDRLVIEPNINYVRSTDVIDKSQLYRQFIARTRFRLQVNPELSVRLVVQYNDSKGKFIYDPGSGPTYGSFGGKAWDIDPLVTYRLNPFSVLHVGSTQDINFFEGTDSFKPQWKLSQRRVFVKLQYLFQG